MDGAEIARRSQLQRAALVLYIADYERLAPTKVARTEMVTCVRVLTPLRSVAHARRSAAFVSFCNT
jgi:hypothetical protein